MCICPKYGPQNAPHLFDPLAPSVIENSLDGHVHPSTMRCFWLQSTAEIVYQRFQAPYGILVVQNVISQILIYIYIYIYIEGNIACLRQARFVSAAVANFWHQRPYLMISPVKDWSHAAADLLWRSSADISLSNGYLRLWSPYIYICLVGWKIASFCGPFLLIFPLRDTPPVH